MTQDLEALDTLYLETAPTPDEVWTSFSEYHVDTLHPDVSHRLLRSMRALVENATPTTPTIAVVQGERGSGKTHLLGWARQQIQALDGFFFYIKLVTGQDFWESAVGSLVDSLYRKDEGGQEQLLRLLGNLSRRAGLAPETHAAVTGGAELTRHHLDVFVRGLRRLDRQVGNEAADTARALVLVASADEAVDIGGAYLAFTEPEPQDRTAWGMSTRQRPAQLVLRDLTRLFALAGPLVFAFDQLDNLIQVSESAPGMTSSGGSRATRRLSGEIAAGLMELREESRRTLMIVACQPGTWNLVSEASLQSALDRVEVLPELGMISDHATAAAIVARRFRPRYASIGFTPPYPTWPVTGTALAEAVHRYTARRLLLRVSDHITECLQSGSAVELTSLARQASPQAHPPAVRAASGTGPGHPAGPGLPPTAELHRLTEVFQRLRSEADDVGPLDKETEDLLMPPLLAAGLRSLVIELGGERARFEVDSEFGGRAALHARLRYTVDEATEKDLHWSFRAIAHDNPRAAQTRIRNAMAEAGLAAGVPSRRLILLRNTPYPTGAKTQEIRAVVAARGGLERPIVAADLRTYAALQTMLDQHPPGLTAWLRQQRPAAGTELFATVVHDLRHAPGPPVIDDTAVDYSGTAARPEGTGTPSEGVVLGRTVRGSSAFSVAPVQLRKHTVVVGAAGSGKTVLIKHLIEQCALRGVSAIVLDPNDDLGRLGDPWPSAPEGWTEEQDGAARRYFDGTEVLVWTPGLQRGRPLAFPPLPDFTAALTDEADFARLLTSTISALAPVARIRGDNARATQQLGVLRRALERYVRDGGQTMVGLLDLLAEPSPDIVNSRTRRFAVDMADTLQAATETDPLLAESGTPTDPGVLLTPSPGRSARISVISFIGLSGDGPARFVSRLQTELFSWFRAHPAGDRPLGGLLVMDEAQNFVPSGTTTASTASTVDLIRQVRKYGLGIVLASQAPRGIHHQALGNTANQFIGRLTAPAQIAAAEAMGQSRNSVLGDLGSLPLATFYAAGEGTAFRKIETPICLTHHTGPLQEDEVVARARPQL